MSKRRNCEDLGEHELEPVAAARVERAVEQAERDLEEARVNFRWGVAQVALIKRAADLAGVPYQTYIKQVVFRQAIADLKDAAGLGLSNQPGAGRDVA
jgi:predicted DNA binding CopG/RHH family protein